MLDNTEIERRFLLSTDVVVVLTNPTRIKQGYLYNEAGDSLRVRVKGDKGFVTVKSNVTEDSLVRNEYEMEIPKVIAERMLEKCTSIIEKDRYKMPFRSEKYMLVPDLVAEVDLFSGDNDGLALVEVEVPFPEYKFELPSFFGKEITGDIRYYNASLSQHPYKEWKHELLHSSDSPDNLSVHTDHTL